MADLTKEEIAIMRENIELMRAHSDWKAVWYIRDVEKLLDIVVPPDTERQMSFGFGPLL